MAAVCWLVLLDMLPELADDLGVAEKNFLRQTIEPPLAPILARTPVAQLCAGCC